MAITTRQIRTARPRHTGLFTALSCALLLGTATQAAAQEDPGTIGDPESWKTEEFLTDWGLEAIGAEFAYARGLTGAGAVLGQFDTGVDLTHSEFSGRGHISLTLADSGCNRDARNASIVYDGEAGGCMQARGDEYNVDAYNVTPNEGDPYAFAMFGSHGTHVAGTMVAARDGVGMHGVAFGSTLATARFFSDAAYAIRQNEDGSWSDPEYLGFSPGGGNIEGVKQTYAQLRELGAQSLNIEVQYFTDDLTEDDLRAQYEEAPEFWDTLADEAIQSNIINVVAAGNSANIPSLFPGVPLVRPDAEAFYLAVGALEQTEDGVYDIAEYSNRCAYAMNWCVMAPGSGVTSSVIDSGTPYPGRMDGSGTEDDPYRFVFDSTEITPEHGYADYSGTSMAAPHAIGALGLLFERFPYLSPTQVRDVLLTTATDLGEPGVDEIYGWGMINLRKAIDGPGMLRVDTDVVMNTPAGGAKVWDGPAWDDWRNDISGPGRLTKSGVGWLRLSGDNTFAGATVAEGILELDGDNALTGDVQVNDGVLILNGTLTGSDLTVNDGAAYIQGTLSGGNTVVGAEGLLGGVGTLGDTLVQGTIAPGNSIGTLNIAGNYTQAAGSFYDVELEPPSSSDRLAVTGTATLEGGTLRVLRSPGDYVLGQTYSILSAGGGIDGEFAQIDTSAFGSPFLPSI